MVQGNRGSTLHSQLLLQQLCRLLLVLLLDQSWQSSR